MAQARRTAEAAQGTFGRSGFFGRGTDRLIRLLPDAVAYGVKAMGFKVRSCTTGGIIPARSRTCTANAGLVGIDVKAPPTDAVLYERVTGRTHAALSLFLKLFECFKRPGFHLNVEPPLTLTIFPIRNF